MMKVFKQLLYSFPVNFNNKLSLFQAKTFLNFLWYVLNKVIIFFGEIVSQAT